MSRRILIKNIGFLYGLQAATYLVPLLTTPYLARVLGVAEFGKMGLAAAAVGYFVIVVDWGFGYTGVEQVARNVRNPAALRRIYWDITCAKAVLACPSVLLLAAVTALVPELRDSWPIVAATGFLLLQTVASPHWFLQGLEKLGAASISSFAARLTTLPLIFLLVKSPHDTWIAAAILSCTLYFASAIAIFISVRATPLLPPSFNGAGILQQLRGGWRLMLSNGAASLFGYTNMFAVGTLAGTVQAGYLNGADRIRRVLQSASTPIVSAMYPRVNNMMVSTPQNVPRLLLKTLIAQAALGAIVTAVMFMAAPWITVVFLGEAFAPAIPVVQLVTLAFFFCCLQMTLGVNAMLPLGMKRAYSNIVIGAGLLNVATIWPLASMFGAIGAAVSYVLSELGMFLAMAIWIYLRRHAITSMLAAKHAELAAAKNSNIGS